LSEPFLSESFLSESFLSESLFQVLAPAMESPQVPLDILADALADALADPLADPLGFPDRAAPLPRSLWVEVLVDCAGAQGLYTYGIPEGMELLVGDIVAVPFGPQQTGAIVLALVHHLPPDLAPTQIRPVLDVISRGFFAPQYWQLLEQVADYYCTPLMSVIRTALPPGLLGRSQRRIRLGAEAAGLGAGLGAGGGAVGLGLGLGLPAQKVLGLLQASKTGSYTSRYLQQQLKTANTGIRELLRRGLVESYLEPPTTAQPKLLAAVTLVHEPDPSDPLDPLTGKLTDKQHLAIATLKRHGGELLMTELTEFSQVSSGVIKTIEKKGYVLIQPREVLRSDLGPHLDPDQPKPLTPDQAKALEAIQDCLGFRSILLHGVTGSGKTEVYLQAIAPVLERGQSALVLVPEIGLTPQLTDRFRQRFGRRVCVYHSGLSEGERFDTWRQMLQPQAQVVVGTRSAVFAPLQNLGLILLDEEHDGSFKQDQPMPCYHARLVAQWRAKLENCPLLLGSATPSLESWVAIKERGRLDSVQPNPLYLTLPERIHARPHPPIEVVDLRLELREGNRSMFSRSLQKALRALKDKGQQGILFIQRRGHSTFVACRSCGTALDCPHCDVSLAYHHTHTDAQPLLRCHYCNHAEKHPDRCPTCASPYLKHFGTGTQRVTQELTTLFPEMSWIRFDSDTTRNKGAHRQLLNKFAEGEADLLVGTQMLTKGIDLPQVTLVGILAADGLLHLSDFRASERAAQTLLQVAGRAGRGEEPGRVILQTYSPEHPVVQAVQQYRYDSVLRQELIDRAALHYPPLGRLILLRLSSPDADAVERGAEQVAAALRDRLPLGWELLGPSPAPIPRIAQRFRWQILLKGSPEAEPMDWAEGWLRTICPGGVSLAIDVDPLNLS
jgi:primosomal protein N' (replication factor Y) (superfamily II helicase)